MSMDSNTLEQIFVYIKYRERWGGRGGAVPFTSYPSMCILSLILWTRLRKTVCWLISVFSRFVSRSICMFIFFVFICWWHTCRLWFVCYLFPWNTKRKHAAALKYHRCLVHHHWVTDRFKMLPILWFFTSVLCITCSESHLETDKVFKFSLIQVDVGRLLRLM